MSSINSPHFKFSVGLFGPTEKNGREFDKTTALHIVLALMLTLGLCQNADAKIVAFTDGRILKAEDAYLDDDSIVIELRGGGTLRVPATRVERVVADEVDDDPAPLPDFADCPWVWNRETLPEGMPFGQEITDAARAAEIHPWLLVAVVRAESNFDPMAVSRAGAAGLTQLMPATASDRGVADVFDPGENLRAGAEYLHLLLGRFESLPLALAAYNAGPTTVDRYEGVPPYRETREYVRKIVGEFCGKPPQSP